MATDHGIHWDQAYATRQQREPRTKPSQFSVSVADQLKPDDVVLELGCGVGVDAVYLASRVRSVTAVDFAEKLINSNAEAFKQTNLVFMACNITQDLNQFQDAGFDAVYARRSLHYFDEGTTKRVFNEIHRILKPGGWLFFEGKSIHDPHVGQVAATGEVRHFFSESELQDWLADFEIERLAEEPAQDFYGFPSVFLTCWARKKNS